MKPDPHAFIGLEAYSREGERIGTVEDVVSDPDPEKPECLVIRYGPFRDLVVPVDAVRRKNGGVTVAISRVFLNGARGRRGDV